MSDDPLTMYYVVRKDVPLTLEEAVALAGAGAVRCRDELGGHPRFADCFRGWAGRPRKVALRAEREEIAALRDELPGPFLGEALLCLPPMRKSDRPPLLAALRPYTDPPGPRDRGESRPQPDEALVYAVRPGVIRTAGKAMAQAGHAALLAVDRLGARLDAWREAGMPGVVERVEDDEAWERLKARPGAVVVRDAGLTQVEAGTETVVAFLR